MNRRAFLASLAATVAGASFDPERLLWVPGQRTYFLPPIWRYAPFVVSDELIADCWSRAIDAELRQRLVGLQPDVFARGVHSAENFAPLMT